MNRIILLGRLVRDPEVRYTTNGNIVTQITLAVKRPFTAKNDEETHDTDYINCVMWGKNAELLGNTLSKGQRVLVEGRLQIRSYDNKSGGKTWVTEVILDKFEYIETKGSSGLGKAKQDQSALEGFGDSVQFVDF